MSDRLCFVSQRIQCRNCIDILKKRFSEIMEIDDRDSLHFDDKNGIFSGHYRTPMPAWDFSHRLCDIGYKDDFICHDINFSILEGDTWHYAMTINPDACAIFEELIVKNNKAINA